MPKKGETQPWKVTFQYATQAKAATHAFSGLGRAVRALLELRGRGAEVSMAYRSSSGTRHDLTDESVIKLLEGLQPPYDELELIERIRSRSWEQTAQDEGD
jgi:hypothetical protein